MVIKTDKRITRSTKDLKDAFIQLLKSKTYSQITVKEIINEAGYSRTAFYARYLNKDDFAIKIIDNEVDYYVDMVYSILQKSKDPYICRELLLIPATNFFEHVYSNRGIYNAILNLDIMENSIDYFCRQAFNRVQKRITCKYSNDVNELIDEYRQYTLAYSYLSSVRFWINHNFEYSPLFMAELINDYHFPKFKRVEFKIK